jgi:predicted hydrolase (HD superfamily)
MIVMLLVCIQEVSCAEEAFMVVAGQCVKGYVTASALINASKTISVVGVFSSLPSQQFTN